MANDGPDLARLPCSPTKMKCSGSATRVAHTITTFNRDGEQLAQWGEHGNGAGPAQPPLRDRLRRATAICSSSTPGNHRVQRFSARRQPTSTASVVRARANGEFDMPWGITVDAEGIDLHRRLAQRPRAEVRRGREFHLATIGHSGDGPKANSTGPAGLAVDADGDLYVADRGNNRVQLFDHRTAATWSSSLGDATISKMGARLHHEPTRRRCACARWSALEPQKRFRAPASVRVDAEGHLCTSPTSDRTGSRSTRRRPTPWPPTKSCRSCAPRRSR